MFDNPILIILLKKQQCSIKNLDTYISFGHSILKIQKKLFGEGHSWIIPPKSFLFSFLLYHRFFLLVFLPISQKGFPVMYTQTSICASSSIFLVTKNVLGYLVWKTRLLWPARSPRLSPSDLQKSMKKIIYSNNNGQYTIITCTEVV